jgi:hypothetical protein
VEGHGYDWHNNPVNVCDAGDIFWEIVFDPKTKKTIRRSITAWHETTEILTTDAVRTVSGLGKKRVHILQKMEL